MMTLTLLQTIIKTLFFTSVSVRSHLVFSADSGRGEKMEFRMHEILTCEEGACMSYLLINYRQMSIRLRGARFIRGLKTHLTCGRMRETGRFAKLLVKKWLRHGEVFYVSPLIYIEIWHSSRIFLRSSSLHFFVFYVILIEKMRLKIPIGGESQIMPDIHQNIKILNWYHYDHCISNYIS